jgi:hypothetical protein
MRPKKRVVNAIHEGSIPCRVLSVLAAREFLRRTANGAVFRSPQCTSQFVKQGVRNAIWSGIRDISLRMVPQRQTGPALPTLLPRGDYPCFSASTVLRVASA